MASFNLGSALATLAPTLASALGGPLAGIAVTALEKAVGVTPGSGSDAVAAAIQNAQLTPEQLVAIKQADADLQEKLGQQQIDLAKINADAATAADTTAEADRASARAKEAATKDSTPRVLAYLITFGFFGILTFLMLGSPPPASQTVLNIMLGALGSAWAGIVSYYFGSSAGSDRKTELLAKSPAAQS